MLLLEFEGKALLRDYGIATPRGAVAVPGAAPDLSGLDAAGGLMLKAQVPAGARGKAGGIRAVSTGDDPRDELRRLFSSKILGHEVERVLVEERVALAHERYMAAMIDGEDMLFVVGKAGGVDVEDLASADRSNFAIARIDPLFGLSEFQVRDSLSRLGCPPAVWPAYAAIATRLVRLFRERDATLAEINPLGELADGSLVALDARIVIDDGALYRQPAIAAIQKARLAGDALQARMKELQIQYTPIGGAIGMLSSGAGLGVTIMDWVAREGERISAFVDLDYAIMAGKTAPAIRLVLDTFEADPEVKAIIVNFTSCGLRMDVVAQTLLDVLKPRIGGMKPITLHLQGNRVGEAHRILREAGLDVVDALGDAVRQAVAAVKRPESGGRR